MELLLVLILGYAIGSLKTPTPKQTYRGGGVRVCSNITPPTKPPKK
ncbi:hypothetical protein [Clostridium intestinale]|uniref:Uncharacterized protein n=1 Tax=Clostridium intestinale TaxID=36845 RepID=A0A7D7A0I8_9CLOT|nr:hypothetical protein [Clostridium intestinale]QLY81922.1 hypothetical protein HZF06_10150 [Clostridium intestinale]